MPTTTPMVSDEAAPRQTPSNSASNFCHEPMHRNGFLKETSKAALTIISHRWLLAHVPMDAVILEKWLRCGFLENANWFATEAGTPQGGIVSPCAGQPGLGWTGSPSEETCFRVVRKRDGGFIPRCIWCAMPMTSSSPAAAMICWSTKSYRWWKQFLRERGLELSAEKTHVTRIQDGFDFPWPTPTQVWKANC
jgi:RNA-directed DNA polymerase